jgi:antirestriction protein ArdC
MNNVMSVVMDRIIEQMEKNGVPWKKPWFNFDKCNLATGRGYTGVNTLSLAYNKDRFFMTFKQISDMGGRIEKGAKGIHVIWWKILTVADHDSAGVTEQTPSVRTIPVMKKYTVFGLSDIWLPEDIKEKLLSRLPKQIEPIPIDEVDDIVQKLVGQIHENHYDTSCYYPDKDMISLPPMSYFKTVEDYYRTLFHEIGHWTAHHSRCNRPLVTSMSSPQYREEELVAEITSVFLCQLFNIPVDVDNSAAYLAGWVKFFKDHKAKVYSAMKQAEIAIEYIKKRLAIETECDNTVEEINNTPHNMVRAV